MSPLSHVRSVLNLAHTTAVEPLDLLDGVDELLPGEISSALLEGLNGEKEGHPDSGHQRHLNELFGSRGLEKLFELLPPGRALISEAPRENVMVTVRQFTRDESPRVNRDVVTEEYGLPTDLVRFLEELGIDRRETHVQAVSHAGSLELHGLSIEVLGATLVWRCLEGLTVLLAGHFNALERVFAPLILFVADPELGLLNLEVFEHVVHEQYPLILAICRVPEHVAIRRIEHGLHTSYCGHHRYLVLLEIFENGSTWTGAVHAEECEHLVLVDELGKGGLSDHRVVLVVFHHKLHLATVDAPEFVVHVLHPYIESGRAHLSEIRCRT